MRLPQYRIFVRSFHPNRIFEETDHPLGRILGGPWGGDNRGFSVDSASTSRVMHSYTANTAEMPKWFHTIKPAAASDPSHGLQYDIVATYPQADTRLIDLVRSSAQGPLYEISGPQQHPDLRISTSGFKLLSQSIPEAKIVRSDLLLDQPCRKAATVVTHHFGVNLAVPSIVLDPGSMVPDLDVFAKVSFDIDRAARTLDLETTVFGDRFPNCEAFLVDENGTRVMLGVFRRVGYPINWRGASTLSGVKTDFMFASQMKFTLDESGALVSFASGKSIKDWNTKLLAFDPNSKDIPTRFVER